MLKLSEFRHNHNPTGGEIVYEVSQFEWPI